MAILHELEPAATVVPPEAVVVEREWSSRTIDISAGLTVEEAKAAKQRRIVEYGADIFDDETFD